jgi:hypothetical protein
MTIQLHGHQCYEQADYARSRQLQPEEQAKGDNMLELISEGRTIEISGWGRDPEMESVQELTLEYAQENLGKVEQALAVSALGVEPTLLAPR